MGQLTGGPSQEQQIPAQVCWILNPLTREQVQQLQAQQTQFQPLHLVHQNVMVGRQPTAAFIQQESSVQVGLTAAVRTGRLQFQVTTAGSMALAP